jgi:hypothetical protein
MSGAEAAAHEEECRGDGGGCGLLRSEEHTDAFVQIVQWVSLLEISRVACVSKHFHATCRRHVQSLDEVVVGGGRAHVWRVDALLWTLRHASCATLRRVDIGSALPCGWFLSHRCDYVCARVRLRARGCARVRGSVTDHS